MRKRGVLGSEVTIKVPFYDIDSMNVVWHGNYPKYLEQARCALLDLIDYNYDAMRVDGYVWPVIDMQLRYVNPAVFAQSLLVRAELIEWENRLRINYLISDATTGERITRASTTQVAVEIASRAMRYVSPPQFVAAVNAALARQEQV